MLSKEVFDAIQAERDAKAKRIDEITGELAILRSDLATLDNLMRAEKGLPCRARAYKYNGLSAKIEEIVSEADGPIRARDISRRLAMTYRALDSRELSHKIATLLCQANIGISSMAIRRVARGMYEYDADKAAKRDAEARLPSELVPVTS